MSRAWTFLRRRLPTDPLESLLVAVGSTFTVAMAAVIGLQIFTRTVFNMPFTWPEELSQLLLVGATFLGAAIVEKYDAHVRVEFLLSRVSATNALVLKLIGKLLTLFLVASVLAGESAILPRITLLKTPAARIPYVWLHAVVVFGFVSWLFYVLVSSKRLIDDYRASERR